MSLIINKFRDQRGVLIPFEFSSLPFVPQRVFLVKDVPVDTTRGNHAHFTTHQFIICLNGSIEVGIIDSKGERTFLLRSGDSAYIPNLTWDWQKFISIEGEILVFASTKYDPEDYITSIKEFKKIIQI